MNNLEDEQASKGEQVLAYVEKLFSIRMHEIL